MLEGVGQRWRQIAVWSVRLCAAAIVVGLVVVSCSSGEEEPETTDPDPVLIDEGALTVCTSFPYEPFEVMKDGKPVGFDIDLANEVAKRLGVKPEFENVAFENIDSGKVLNEGMCDVAIAALSINGKRARALDFSSPYFNDAGQAMVVKNDSGITSLADLGGRKIAVQQGTTGESYVIDNAPNDTEIVPLANAAQIDAALNDDEVDAAVYDNSIAGDAISRFPEFEVAIEFPTGEQYGMAVKKNSNVDLLRVVNEVLADLQATGKYDAIYDRWFGDATVGS